MTPRLKTSKKWTALPKELCEQIREVFVENFSAPAKNGKIIVDGRIYSQELLLRIGYLEKGRLKQANFEVSVDFDPNKQNAMAQIHTAVDCAASMLEEYFQSELDLSDFPISWSLLELDKVKVYVQTSTINTELESEADRLLGELADELVHAAEDADEETEKEAVISMLGLSGEEDFPDEMPTDEKTAEVKSKKKPQTSKPENKKSKTDKKNKPNLH